LFAGEDESISTIYSESAKRIREKPEGVTSSETDSKIADEAKTLRRHLYWVLYYDSRDEDPKKHFFIHTPTQCSLNIKKMNKRDAYPKWAIDKNNAIHEALEKVKEKYKEAKKIDPEVAWRLLIYLRHLVKDVAFVEEQEMRILTLCPLGKAKRLRDDSDILSQDYLPIFSKENQKLDVVAGPKMANFGSRSTRWLNTIKEYEDRVNDGKKEEEKVSFKVTFRQSEAPLA
jgi:hypothetical protein